MAAPWYRLQVGTARHRKFRQVTWQARWFYLACLDYTTEYLTDGFIADDEFWSAAFLEFPKPRRCLTQLVPAGLLERVEGGYRVHDYLEYNPCRATVERRREYDRQRKIAKLNETPEHSARTDLGQGTDKYRTKMRQNVRVHPDILAPPIAQIPSKTAQIAEFSERNSIDVPLGFRAPHTHTDLDLGNYRDPLPRRDPRNSIRVNRRG